MTTPRNLYCAALLCSALVFPFPASAEDDASSKEAKVGTLQIQVNVPPTWRPLWEDRVTDAFVSYLTDVFRRQGYKGEFDQVSAFDEPSAGCCLLTIHLIEWEMNHVGNIDCTFTADLQSKDSTRNLGVFSGMAFRWVGGPGRFGLADAFGDAAEEASRQLYDRVARTELVPGLRE